MMLSRSARLLRTCDAAVGVLSQPAGQWFAGLTYRHSGRRSSATVSHVSRSRFKYRQMLRHGVEKAMPRHASNQVERAAAQMLRQPEMAAEVMASLPVDERQRVALAWAMSELEEEFVKADTDRDGKLSYNEFKAWALAAIETGSSKDSGKMPTNRQLSYVALGALVPFVGFGMVDNGLMVIFGDVIDGTLGCWLGTSMLASAAVGNAVSNVFGMVLHGTITKWSSKIGIPDPQLSLTQRKLPKVHIWSTAGSTVGVFVGCLLGMTPLLFMDQTKKEEERAHAKHHEEAAAKVA